MDPVDVAMRKIRAQRAQKAYRVWLRDEIERRTATLREYNTLMDARPGNFLA